MSGGDGPKKLPSGLRQCFGKKRYVTFEYAVSVAERFGNKTGKPMRVYFCALCNGHHLTSKPRR